MRNDKQNITSRTTQAIPTEGPPAEPEPAPVTVLDSVSEPSPRPNVTNIVGSKIIVKDIVIERGTYLHDITTPNEFTKRIALACLVGAIAFGGGLVIGVQYPATASSVAHYLVEFTKTVWKVFI